jgi:hypothetical protein
MTEPLYESDKWELEDSIDRVETLLGDVEARLTNLETGIRESREEGV